MAILGHHLSQRLTQSQTLALTPAMQLKLKLWQMNLQELTQTIEEELEANPLLEVPDDLTETPTAEALIEGRDSEVPDDATTIEGIELPEGIDSVDLGPMIDSALEMNPEDNLEKFTNEGIAQVQETEMGAENAWDMDLPRTSNLPDEDRTSWEDRLTSSVTLHEHLLSQLYQAIAEDDPRGPLLEALIDHVDPKGFLRVDPDSPLETTPEQLAGELGIDVALLPDLLDILQDFDPSGVGCFTVQESLLVQLQHAGAEPDDLAVRIIKIHSDLLSQRDSTKLRKALNCSETELTEAMDILKHLNPSPGRAYDPESERIIKPDVVVLRGEDGNWKVYLNDDGIPSLRINQGYQSFLNASQEKSDRDYIRERYRSARDFIRGVEDRNRTVLRVAACIVGLQQDFMEHGTQKLRPMVLRDVAEATGFHESTISRVVKAKTIHTPQGLFDLNYFFSASLGSSSGDDVSATAVKHRIKAIIQAEDSAKPLSDEAIAKLLERDGIKVARRTVNKYREELRIPSASLRRHR
ncbi:MAG: RNA polymerase factor sigma-54 [Holophagales bacterium]|jgi:RNA polymerase sigma-54 factor|nr:RNA polymerase factor sigma-54 [Holophagales bacterium]